MDNQEVTLVLAEEKSGIQIGDKIYVLDPDQDLASQRVPPESGGLLVALHLWRKFLVAGPASFGDVIYFGTIPDPLQDSKIDDVLVATAESVECNFLFNTNDNLLSVMEMFPDLNSDPCVVRFFDYQVDQNSGPQLAPLTVPGEIRFSTADVPEKIFKIVQIEFLENK